MHTALGPQIGTWHCQGDTHNHVPRVELVHAKILKMNDTCHPKICMLRLQQLADRNPQETKFNWAAQFREFLEVDALDLWGNPDPGAWASRTETIFARYEYVLKERDLESWRRSESCQLNLPRTLDNSPENFVKLRLHLPLKKVIIQIRLATKYVC